MARKRITPSALARAMDTNHPRVARILNGGKTLTIEDLNEVCSALELDPLGVICSTYEAAATP